MKKQIATLLAGAMLAVCSTFAVATTASAYTIGLTNVDVGARDIFLANTKLGNSGDTTELLWVKSILGYEVTFDAKYDTQGGAGWIQTKENATTYALALDTRPEYFLIKTANGTFDHFLFQNQAGLDWAIVNLTQDFGEGYSIKNIGKFSHVNEYGTGAAPVPEPGTMLLLSVGMFCLAIYGKRYMNKNQ